MDKAELNRLLEIAGIKVPVIDQDIIRDIIMFEIATNCTRVLNIGLSKSYEKDVKIIDSRISHDKTELTIKTPTRTYTLTLSIK